MFKSQFYAEKESLEHLSGMHDVFGMYDVFRYVARDAPDFAAHVALVEVNNLVLLCHKLSLLADSLAAGALVELSREKPDDDDPDGRDGVFHVALRPDWRSLVGGSMRLLQGV